MNNLLEMYISFRRFISFIRLLPLRSMGMKIGTNVIIGSYTTFSIPNVKNIFLSNNVFIKSHCSFFSLPSHKKSIFGMIQVGEGTHINDFVTIVANNKIVIGKNCLFARNVSLFDHDHIFSKKLHPTKSGLTEGKPISIGDDVYLGNNVVVLKGVTLGSHVVVGANSVITKSFPSGVIIAGSPAKIIKKLP